MEKERAKDKEYFEKIENEINKEQEMDKKEERNQIKRKTFKRQTNKKQTRKASKNKNENLIENEKSTSKFVDKDKDIKNEKNLEEQKDIEKLNIGLKDKIEENEKEKNINIEYEIFLGTKEIFTILSLIGVNILNSEIEEKIENELKNKYIMDKYLTKKDFMEYIFWFEPFFEYVNDKSKINDDKNINNSKLIKEFLFDIWKNDDNSTYFDFKKFLEVLRSNRYVTDLTNNEVRYYDIIFDK